MKAIEGNLPVNKEYKLIDIYYGKLEDGGSVCENCGKIIANIATIEADGEKYDVGVDCAEGLLQTSSSDYWDLQQKKKEYNRKLSMIRKIKKHLKDDNLDVRIKEGWLTFYKKEYSYATDSDQFVWTSRYSEQNVEGLLRRIGVNLYEVMNG